MLKYLINIPLALFALLYLWKYKYSFKLVERLFSFLQDAAIITCFNIFIIKYQYITQYGIDFYVLCIVGIIELVEVFLKMVAFCRRGEEDHDDMGGEVAPEKEGRG